jgi:hypothetical protein
VKEKRPATIDRAPSATPIAVSQSTAVTGVPVAAEVLDAAVSMTKTQRKDWREYVLGCAALTPAQRLVLLALEGFADYPAGTNARPGVKRLAEICALRDSAVEKALARGRDLQLIRQTGRANPKRSLAAVYRLIPAPVSTRTAVRTETGFNPYGNEFQPVREDASTRTYVQPTNPLTPIHNTERENPAAGCAVDALSDIAPQDEEQPNPEPPPFCPQHMPYGPDGPCGPCGTRRVAREEWKKRQTGRTPTPAPRPTLNPDCPLCGGYGRLLGDEDTPVRPAVPCPSCRPASLSAGAES